MVDDDDEIPTLIETAESSETTVEAGTSVPLTIICGFLGAGKSTLVRRILTERHGYRIAVIMNDFGDTADIEAKTINVRSPDDPEGETAEELLELANGCLCCSIKDTGIAAIEKLMKRKGAFDHILLETTGLADPGPIASMFWLNEEYAMGLGRDIHLDGVVCIVDAVFGEKQIEEDHASSGIGESLRQIAGSDVVLINKVDLRPLQDVDRLQNLVVQVNPAATIYRTTKGEIDLGLIMGIGAYSSRPKIAAPVEEASSCGAECHEEHHDHTHADGHHHYQIRGISSLQIVCPTLTSDQMRKLDEWIRTVLWESRIPENAQGASNIEVLRCKGIFATDNGEVHVLQGVRSIYDIGRLEDGDKSSLDEGKLVFIGKGLDEGVSKSFHNAISL